MTDARSLGESTFKQIYDDQPRNGRRPRPFVGTQRLRAGAHIIKPTSALGLLLLERLGIGLRQPDMTVGMYVDAHDEVWSTPAAGRVFIPVYAQLARFGTLAAGAYLDDGAAIAVATDGRHWAYSENLWRKDAWVLDREEFVPLLRQRRPHAA
jgi:hypothetical protein